MLFRTAFKSLFLFQHVFALTAPHYRHHLSTKANLMISKAAGSQNWMRKTRHTLRPQTEGGRTMSLGCPGCGTLLKTLKKRPGVHVDYLFWMDIRATSIWSSYVMQISTVLSLWCCPRPQQTVFSLSILASLAHQPLPILSIQMRISLIDQAQYRQGLNGRGS